jgi:hypothetical protein
MLETGKRAENMAASNLPDIAAASLLFGRRRRCRRRETADTYLERRGRVTYFVALAVFDHQLQLVTAGFHFFGQREAVLDVEIAPPAAAAIVDDRELTARQPFTPLI